MQKVIIITGASSGMGKETAVVLAKRGHKVYAAARRVEQMEAISSVGGVAFACDVTNAADIERLVNTVIAREGKIDVLWNNAGYGLFGAVEDVPVEDARRQFEVNLFGMAALTQLVLPHMRAASSGLIINTSSMGGKMYTPLGAWYHATKHAVEGWSDCLRIELKPFNINVAVLEPGIIKTEFGDVLSGPLLKYSGSGAYKALAHALANTTAETYKKPGQYSEPVVVTDAVINMVETNQPKTRYRVGKFAKLLVWLRIYLGDRIFDNIVLSQFK